jgi:hypothetical protein
MKKQILAMPAAATAIPPNPKTAATRAIKKKVKAQLNMSASFDSLDRTPLVAVPRTATDCKFVAMGIAFWSGFVWGDS